MSDFPKLMVRVTMVDGKLVKRELMIDGVKQTDVSKVQLVEFIMQAVSSLRFD